MAVTSARAIVNIKKKHFEPQDAKIDKYTLADELPAKLSELQLRPRVMVPSFKLRRLTPDDKDAVLDHAKQFFFYDEPMNQAVKLLDAPDYRCVELEEYACSTLDQGVSFAAFDDQGEIVGLIINGIVNRKDANNQEKTECRNEKFSRILNVLKHLDEQAKIWEALPSECDKVIEIMIASTHSDWRGRGLMKALTEETERIAQEVGAKGLRMDATSAFSAAVAERFKYRCIYKVRYCDLPDAPVPEPPHHEARVYIKEI